MKNTFWVGLFLLLSSSVSWAQQKASIGYSDNTPESKKIQIRYEPTGIGVRYGGYGYVVLQFSNPDSRDHQLTIELAPAYRDRVFSVKKSIALAAGAETKLFLPLPNLHDATSLRIQADSGPQQSLNLPYTSNSEGVSVLSFTDRSLEAEAWKLFLQDVLAQKMKPKSAGSRFGGAATANFQVRRIEDIPDRWFYLSGFDGVIVDGKSPLFSPERQETIYRYLSGGGRLLIYGAQFLPKGALQELVDRSKIPDVLPERLTGKHGFGVWFAVMDAETEETKAQLHDWLSDDKRSGLFANAGRGMAGPLPDAYFQNLDIPGLGEVPVRLFFLLILGFAVFVGPVNYFFFKKKHRLNRLLVTVPATGFGMTIVILIYGIFSDGFGIQGVTRSLSILDQKSHRIVTLSGQTLFAGLAPSRLIPDADSYFFSRDFAPFRSYSDQMSSHVLEIDMDRGFEVSGAALPARTPTQFVLLGQKTARERLRFRRLPSGVCHSLSENEFMVRDNVPFVLRDFQGQYFQSKGQGELSAISAGDWEKSRTVLLNAFLNWRLPSHDFDHYFALDPALSKTLLGDWLDQQIPKELRPGSYCGFLNEIPSLDRLGIEFSEKSSSHLVYGLLAEEDFLE